MKTKTDGKVKFWERSKVYQDKRRPQNLGAFKKWKRENPAEAERIEFRFQNENQISQEV